MSTLAKVRERRAHWRRCRELLREVPVPDVFDVDDYAEQVARHRGRPLRVLSQQIDASGQGPCGAWLSTSTEDLIFVDPDVTPLHREHIVLHELGHMLCDHAAPTLPAHELVAQLVPHLSPDLVRRVLGRTSYATQEEVEAEVFATTVGASIIARAAMAAPLVHRLSDVGDDAGEVGGVGDVLRRLSGVMGGSQL